MLPPEVFNAARGGDLAAVQNWLEQGGNPNEGIEQVIKDMIPSGACRGREVSHKPGSTLLMAAASIVAARLFFGSLTGFDDVPNKCFWRVVEYAWLGDWRHP